MGDYTMAGELMKGREAYVWLVWGIRENGRCDLVAIATTEDARTRYRAMGERDRNYKLVKDEMVMLDHAFGQSMLPNALNRRQRNGD